VRAAREFIQWCDNRQEHRCLIHLEALTLSIDKKRYIYLAILEEDLWKQRASLKWKLQGDRNTAYFHLVIFGHKHKNFIKEVKENDEIHKDQLAKGRIFFQYYCQLMGKESQPMLQIQWSAVYEMIEWNIDTQFLARPISNQEIGEVIDQLPSGKMLRSDGFTILFYKTFKNQLILDLLTTFLYVTSTGSSLSPLNNSCIVLIPKLNSAIRPSDFRPISVVHGVQIFFPKF
jgi:hypothetical protein